MGGPVGKRVDELESLRPSARFEISLDQIKLGARVGGIHAAQESDRLFGPALGQPHQPQIVVCGAVARIDAESACELPLRPVEFFLRRVADAQIVMGLGRAAVDLEGLLEGSLRLRVVLLLLVNDPEQVQALRAPRLELQPFANLLERLFKGKVCGSSKNASRRSLGTGARGGSRKAEARAAEHGGAAPAREHLRAAKRL